MFGLVDSSAIGRIDLQKEEKKCESEEERRGLNRAVEEIKPRSPRGEVKGYLVVKGHKQVD